MLRPEPLEEERLVRLHRIMRELPKIVAMLLMAGGCTSPGQFVGYLTNDSENIQLSYPRVAPPAQQATLLRSEVDNLLDVQIFGPKAADTETSAKPGDYAVLLKLTSPVQGLPDAPEVFIPLLNSENLRLSQVSRDESKSVITLEIFGNKFGIDLLLTALTAPGGVQGIAYYSQRQSALPIDARAFRPGFVWGKVFLRGDPTRPSCIGIQNITEYPIQITKISIGNASGVAGAKLGPFSTSWDCSVTGESFDVRTLSVAKMRFRAVPNEILAVYLKRSIGGLQP
jgi:hypothetical protein